MKEVTAKFKNALVGKWLVMTSSMKNVYLIATLLCLNKPVVSSVTQFAFYIQHVAN